MAIILKQRFGLVVLRIALDLSGSETWVLFDLEGGGEGHAEPLMPQQRVPIEEIGVPERLERRATLRQGIPFELPDSVLDAIGAALEHDHGADDPVWIHLVKPCGYLSMVPWERLLRERLPHPLLRLPDFLVDSSHGAPGRLEVAICSSSPIAKEDFHLVETLESLVDILTDGHVRERVRVHVFVEPVFLDELQRRLQDRVGPDGPVRLHEPSGAGDYGAPERDLTIRSDDRIVNPWLLWMQDALSGRSIDVVHFLAHGYAARGQGALALSESPRQNEDLRMARFVGAPELNSFCERIGAWGTVFSSPDPSHSEMGLRALAYELAELRPGPVLHHELRLDPSCLALREAERFLFGSAEGPAPSPPPRSPALFLYCHPELLGQTTTEEEQTAQAILTSDFKSLLEDIRLTEESVPTWLSASERYMQKQSLEIGRLTEQIRSGSLPRASSDVEELTDTLGKIQSIVADFSRRERS
ncbi:MAG: hypothetical protein NXI30_12695 [bacterium]|nr:hypothetical protein [bacterium]